MFRPKRPGPGSNRPDLYKAAMAGPLGFAPMGLQAEKSTGRVLAPILWDWSLAFEQAPTQRAFAYWRSCCGAHSMPARSDISPSGMSKFLARVILVEIQRSPGEDDQYRIRLAGSQVEEVVGPIGGRDIGSFLTPELVVRWRDFFGKVRAAEKPARLTGRVSYENKVWLSGEALLAPLRDETGAVSMLFMAVSFQPAGNRAAG